MNLTIIFRWTVDDSPTDLDSEPVLSDPVNAWGLRAVSDHTILAANNTVLSRDTTGVYSASIENAVEGTEYEYYVKYTFHGLTKRIYFTKLATTSTGLDNGDYVTIQELYDEVGEQEARRLAKTKPIDTDEAVNRKLSRAMGTADILINRILKSAGYALPLTPLPGKDESDIPTNLIRLCGAKISHWQLYNTRGKRDNDQEGSHVQEKYDWAISQLTALVEEGIPAVTDPDEPIIGSSSMKFSRMKPHQSASPTDQWSQ